MFSCSSGDQPEAAGSPGLLVLPRRTPVPDASDQRRSFAPRICGWDRRFDRGAWSSAKGARAQARLDPTPPIVFTNFLLFDGKSNALRGGLALIVEGGRIKAVATGNPAGPEGARTIDCGGRVVMPGLIDAHWHCMFAALSIPTLFAADVGYIFLAASAEAERTLMRGFTTVRDLGGPSFALKQAIDEGLVSGPRIYPCGAMITTTGGHGDMRPLSDLPRSPGGPVSAMERTGAANIADSADEVRLRVREQLLQGASQIKLVGGGGVSSPRTTLDMLTFSEPELRAGVEAAADRNTYVAVHAYPPVAIQRALAAGVQCIEHGHLMDEATAKLMADKGVWLSIQPFVGEEDTVPLSGQSRINLAPGDCRHEHGLPIGESLQAQDRLRLGSFVFRAEDHAPRNHADPSHALVRKRRSPEDGHRDQWRTAGAVRAAQPLSREARRASRKALSPIFSSSTAIPSPTSR